MCHQTYIQMIYEAILNSNKHEQARIGISRQRIASYIKQNYSVSNGATFNTHLRKSLNKCIENGSLIYGSSKCRFKLKKGLIKELKKKKKQAKNKKKTMKKTKPKKKKQKEKPPPKPSQESEPSEDDLEDHCCESGCENDFDLVECRYCDNLICEDCLGRDHWGPPLDVTSKYTACSGCAQSNNEWSGAWENYRENTDSDEDERDED
eukprot:403251_1